VFDPLLEDSSLAVRYTAAFDVKPFDRARFEAVLTALAESSGEMGQKARSSLECDLLDAELHAIGVEH
jgi:hypothetical protein